MSVEFTNSLLQWTGEDIMYAAQHPMYDRVPKDDCKLLSDLSRKFSKNLPSPHSNLVQLQVVAHLPTGGPHKVHAVPMSISRQLGSNSIYSSNFV